MGGPVIAPKGSAKVHHFIGLDGEGVGRRPHEYTFLGAADAKGKVYLQVNTPSTVQAFKALVSLPRNATLVAFSFGYDLTKILADLPNEAIYLLFRPELRQRWHFGQRRIVTDPVRWKGWSLDWCAGRFTVKNQASGRKAVIWDLFKFFACSFVSALETWQAAPPEAIARIKAMKDQRSEFESLDSKAVNDYCLEECRYLAELAARLYDAHIAAGLQLKGFYGAGSTGAALLRKLDVQGHMNDGPEEMRAALAGAFYGGRFEISRCGVVKGRAWNYDISSAYPYQCTRLPCLSCGHWTEVRTEKKALRCRAAIVKVEVAIDPNEPWGPLPFRSPKGEISYPHSCTTWVWASEYQAAKRLFPDGITFVGAWALSGDCECGRPYPLAAISEVYRERVRLGKEGQGLALKLGANSVYGKFAQSIGTPQFQSWVWAGMITAGCRAQMLDMLGLVTDRSQVLMIATDGIVSRERIDPPKPWDTGTFDLKKPLGGWEEKPYPKGVVLLRPGVYFPLEPSPEEMAGIRARGIGRRTMVEHYRDAQLAIEQGREGHQFPSVSRFVGAVSGIWLTPSGQYVRSEDYGEWVEREIKLSFSPLPKRENGFKLRDYGGFETTPYTPALISPEAAELAREGNELYEQRDGDYEPY